MNSPVPLPHVPQPPLQAPVCSNGAANLESTRQESIRLARLHQLAIMDTGSEPVFDALARMASTLCAAPIALVSLVDETRQWFKANIGLEGVAQTHRDIAFCAHAIQKTSVMEIPDTLSDARFAANPLVTADPHIRFYAGAPIVMPGGERLGTLCVIDRQARQLSDTQRQGLADLAAVVAQVLLLRERAYYLHLVGDEARFKALSDSSPLGIFHTDASGACTYTNPRWQAIYGLDLAQSLGFGWTQAIHPSERAAIFAQWQASAMQGSLLNLEFRLLRPTGQVLHVRSQARAVQGNDSGSQAAALGFVGVVEDITERKQIETQLRESNSFRDRAELIAGVGGWELDLQLRTLKWTDQNCRIYDLPPGFTPSLGEHLRFFSSEDQALIERTASDCINSGKSWDLELPMTTASGRAAWVRSIGRAEYEAGQPRRLTGALQDITVKKTVEEQLRQSQERLQRALDASRLVLWDVDVPKGTVYLSESWAAMQGLAAGEIAKPSVTTLDALLANMPSDDREYARAAMTAAILGHTPRYAVEHRYRTSSGQTLWIQSEGRVTLRDAAGNALRVTGTNQDISARKATELQLARAGNITRATLESSDDGILVVNAALKVLHFNQRIVDMLQVPTALHDTDQPTLLRHVCTLLKNPATFLEKALTQKRLGVLESFDLLEFKDGRCIERYVRPHVFGDEPPGSVVNFRDVTAREITQQQLRQAKAAAESANRAKSEFLATMSHEIRTPLSGIIGITNMLLEEPLSPQQRLFAQLIDGSAQSLLTLINDFLDLAKIEAGKTVLEELPLDLHRLLGDLVNLFSYRASARDLVFRSTLAPGLPQWVCGDPTRLRQILNNLLSNALKFTPKGEFSLSVHGAPLPGNQHCQLVFTVADTGIGITPEAQARLFEQYMQADATTVREFGGTGLGLSIVRQLSELMGGSITLRSAVGSGSAFTVTLPKMLLTAPGKTAAELAAASATAPPLRQVGKVLLAEDNETNQIVAMGQLRKMGLQGMQVVGNGQLAVEAALGGSFDLILMDCHMPVMDGLQAAQTLRDQGCRIPIIAMTANAAEGDAQKCLSAGMNDYLSKPVNPAALQQTLLRWLPLPTPTAVPAEPSAAGQALPTALHAALAPAATQPLFDRPVALARLSGDADLLARVVDSFLTHTPELLAQLEKDLSAGDKNAVHHHVHSLQGSSAAVAAAAMEAVLASIAGPAQRGELAAVQAALPQLAAAVAQFASAAQPYAQKGSSL